MSGIVVYTYRNCDSCRRATKWLLAQGVGFEERAIRERPPMPEELRAMLEHRGGDRRKLCNTSGADYRASGLGEKLNELDDHAFFELLTGNGNLIKRPFMLGVGVGLTGFKEDEWAAALAG